MTYIEMLQDANFKRRLETKIVAHINDEYMKAGISPPLPKFRNNMVNYDEPSVTKLANRVRTGAVLLAQLLDEQKGEENA
ncbi:hypothetical protein ACX1NY_11350 [Acinetobacter sp. ANC 4631]